MDFYFRAKEEEKKEVIPVKTSVEDKSKKRVSKKVDIAQDVKIYKAIQKVRKDLTCMDVLLEECACAKWESTYKKHRNTAMDIISVMVKDLSLLTDYEPKILEEVYW